MLGVASLYLDEESSVTQQSARRKRDLKREIDFFCKELASVSCEVPEASVRLCECVMAVGTVALDMGVSFSAPFQRIDKLLKWTVDSLQHARPADPDRKHLSSPHFKVLAGNGASTPYRVGAHGTYACIVHWVSCRIIVSAGDARFIRAALRTSGEAFAR
jgi:hypothetical protein